MCSLIEFLNCIFHSWFVGAVNWKTNRRRRRRHQCSNLLAHISRIRIYWILLYCLPNLLWRHEVQIHLFDHTPHHACYGNTNFKLFFTAVLSRNLTTHAYVKIYQHRSDVYIPIMIIFFLTFYLSSVKIIRDKNRPAIHWHNSKKERKKNRIYQLILWESNQMCSLEIP